MKNAIRFVASAALGIAQALVIASLIVLPLSISPSKAQFADQSTWIATPGGTANAITLPVVNWTRNYPGQPIHFLPTADNTTAVSIVVNGIGSPIALLQKNNTGLTALSGGELRAGQWASIAFDGTEWVLDDPLGKYTYASTLANSALSFGMVVNLQINATVSTNALTIALKTGSAGADPTATTPILIPFRDSTIANGGPKVVPVTSALSFTIASGSTMGCISGQMCRLWVVGICSSGLECTNSAGSDVVGLCAFNALSGNNVATINEAALQTSASGTSGGNSAQTYYCNISAVTARAVRIMGYIDIQEATAGTWATGPTYTQLFGPGIKRPGDLVSEQFVSDATLFGTTSGTQVPTALTVPMTLQSAANLVDVQASASVTLGGNAGGAAMAVQINRVISGTPTPIGQPMICGANASGTSSGYCGIPMSILDAPGATTVSYTVYIERSNGSSSATYSNGTIVVRQIMGAIEPANDDGPISAAA